MQPLAKQEKLILLQIARYSIQKRIIENSTQLAITPEIALQQPGGAFVTLHKKTLERSQMPDVSCYGRELRGCIGRIRSEDPLYRVVQEMAIAAATRDPRFLPVTAEEISNLLIEISVLSVPQVLKDFSEIQIGQHGLIITEGKQSGLLLPQVAREEGWNVEIFLSHTCLKAGLPMDYWSCAKPKIEIFTAEVFSEMDDVES